MTPENFVYWLHGFLELSHQVSLDDIQTRMIRDHLKLVLDKKTPTYTISVPPMSGKTSEFPHCYFADSSRIDITC